MRLEPNGRSALPPPPLAPDVVFEAETPSHLRDYIAVVRRHFRLAVTCFAATLALAV